MLVCLIWSGLCFVSVFWSVAVCLVRLVCVASVLCCGGGMWIADVVAAVLLVASFSCLLLTFGWFAVDWYCLGGVFCWFDLVACLQSRGLFCIYWLLAVGF